MSSVHNTTITDGRHVLKEVLGNLILMMTNVLNRKVIVISNAVKNHLRRKQLLPSKKSKLIYYGIKPFFVPDAPFELMRKYKAGPIIGTVGRLSPQKGHIYLIRAFADILRTYPNTNLLIIGHDHLSYKEKLDHEIKKQHIPEDRIHFLGHRTDVLECIQIFDIFLFPSLWEGFGLVLLEAMLMKKPVVASNISPINEIVQNDNTGILVEPKNAQELSRAVIQLIEEPTRQEKFGRNGSERVSECFSINKMISAHESLYANL